MGLFERECLETEYFCLESDRETFRGFEGLFEYEFLGFEALDRTGLRILLFSRRTTAFLVGICLFNNQ